MTSYDQLEFCPQLATMIRSGKTTGRSGTIRKITGFSTLNNLVTLRNLFTKLKPKRSLEVGLAYGGSGLVFTASHFESGAPPLGQHTAIDPFQTAWCDDAAIIAIEVAGLREYLDFRAVAASVALPQLVAESAKFELIYIDGSHHFEDVFVDFYFATRLLTDGGVVAFDDSAYPAIRKVLHFIQTNCGFAYEPFDLASYRADKGETLRYRVAKMFRKNQLTAFRKIGPATREWNSAFRNF